MTETTIGIYYQTKNETIKLYCEECKPTKGTVHHCTLIVSSYDNFCSGCGQDFKDIAETDSTATSDEQEVPPARAEEQTYAQSYHRYQFSIQFIVSKKESPAQQFPFTVTVDAMSHKEACKIAWERIREEQRHLLGTRGYDHANTCQFRTESL